MPDNPKTLGIIILLINLLVLGPTSWIIKNLRTDMIDIKELSRTRDDAISKRLSSLEYNLASHYTDQDSHHQDISQIKDRINTLEERLYELRH